MKFLFFHWACSFPRRLARGCQRSYLWKLSFHPLPNPRLCRYCLFWSKVKHGRVCSAHGTHLGVAPASLSLMPPFSSHRWRPSTSPHRLEGPVTPWAIALEVKLSLSILFLGRGAEAHSEASKVRSLQGNCQYSPSAFILQGAVGTSSLSDEERGWVSPHQGLFLNL